MAILSHAFWQRRFGGDSSVIGKTIQINNGPTQIVGIAAPDVKLLFPPATGVVAQPDVYAALRIDWSTASRNNVFLRLVGRLKPGATIATAQAQLDKLAADLRERFPIKKAANLALRAEPMQRRHRQGGRPAILALMGAVVFVLLIACANVANLLLVRASARERELAVRAALGGSRGVLVAQMLAESLLLAACGAVLGLGLAKLGIDLLLAIAPSNLPRVDAVAIDPMVLASPRGRASASAVDLRNRPGAPRLAAQSRRDAARRRTHAGAAFRKAAPPERRRRRGRALVRPAHRVGAHAAQLHGARARRSRLRSERRADVHGVQRTRARTRTTRAAFMRAMQTRLAAIPGVTAVTAASPLPLDGQDANARWGTLDARTDPSKFQQANLHIVLPGYFDAMKTSSSRGARSPQADNDTTSRSIIIDELLAAKAFPGQSPQSIIGKQMFCRINTPEAQTYEVIGVVGHQRHLTLSAPGREAIFTTDGFFGFGAANRWAVRTTGDPTRLTRRGSRAVAQVDPMVPLGELKPMSAYVDRAMAPTRFSLVLIGVFGAVAAMLAAVGLYGVLSTTVRQRTAEIGVRMAFGAPSESIFRLMIGQGLALSADRHRSWAWPRRWRSLASWKRRACSFRSSRPTRSPTSRSRHCS